MCAEHGGSAANQTPFGAKQSLEMLRVRLSVAEHMKRSSSVEDDRCGYTTATATGMRVALEAAPLLRSRRKNV